MRPRPTPRAARHVHYPTAMFEYVKNQEIEQRRKMTIISAVLLIAAILAVVGVLFSYA